MGEKERRLAGAGQARGAVTSPPPAEVVGPLEQEVLEMLRVDYDHVCPVHGRIEEAS